MSKLLEFFNDMRDNGYGLAEIAAQLGTSAIAEPVAGFAAMYDPANGADAIREGMTYQPRSEAAKMYQQGASNVVGQAIKPVMPVIDAWQKGVDIAGKYSPSFGALLKTVPTAIGVTLGAKPALQTGRNMSEGLGAMQQRMIANASAPRTLNAGYMGQRGTFAGISALTADKEALAKAQQMIAQGVDPEDVWKETGWGRGADGKWRFEIDDSKARLRDYQFTPKEAYEQARTNALINDNELMRNRAKSMSEYASMTKNQLRDEYKRTGNEIVDAAINGDIEKAKLLSEKRSGLDALLSQMGSREYGKTSSFIAHGDLGRAYPDVYKIHTRVSPDDVGNANALYYRGNDLQSEQIVLGRKPILNSDKSTMLHELQHAIQQREGFARGGNPEQFRGFYKDPYEAYRKLGGEVEARMVQNRMNLDAQQRRDIYPFAVGKYGYEDIPKSEQIFNYGDTKSMSQRPLTEFEQAHLTAQRNAALPVEKGGLGLHPDNTAMDRARAMGFDVDNPVYHGTGANIDAFDLSRSGSASGAEQYGTGVYTTTNPTLASGYANSTVQNANVLPLVTRMANPISDETAKKLTKAQIKKIIEQSPDLDEQLWNYGDVGYEGKNKVLNDAVNSLYEYQGDKMLENLHPIANDFFKNNPVEFNNAAAKVLKKDGVVVSFPRYNEKFNIPWNANQVRSRFAAFDPFNRDSANLLAQYGAIAPTTALGAYMYNEKRKKSQGNQ